MVYITFPQAVVYATRAHGDQMYGDLPYIFHLMDVARRVQFGERVAAILHDVLEDTEDPLPLNLFPAEVEALVLLTRPPGMGYFQYITQIGAGEGPAYMIEQAVKRADRDSNLAAGAKGGRLKDRYTKALWTLRGQPIG